LGQGAGFTITDEELDPYFAAKKVPVSMGRKPVETARLSQEGVKTIRAEPLCRLGQLQLQRHAMDDY